LQFVAFSGQIEQVRHSHERVVDPVSNAGGQPIESRKLFHSSQSLLGFAALGDIDIHTDKAEWPAACVALDPTFGKNPTYPARGWSRTELNRKRIVTPAPLKEFEDLPDLVTVLGVNQIQELLPGGRSNLFAASVQAITEGRPPDPAGPVHIRSPSMNSSRGLSQKQQVLLVLQLSPQQPILSHVYQGAGQIIRATT